MKIRMKATSAGPDGVLNEGKVYDVDDAKAQGLVSGGYAVEVAVAPPAPEEVADEADTPEAEPETAVAPPAPEEATAAPQRRTTGRGK